MRRITLLCLPQGDIHPLSSQSCVCAECAEMAVGLGRVEHEELLCFRAATL